MNTVDSQTIARGSITNFLAKLLHKCKSSSNMCPTNQEVLLFVYCRVYLIKYRLFLTTMFFLFFRLSMECGPSLSSAWPSLRRVPFCQTQVACWQDICRLPRFYTFCSFPMIIPWNISSLTPLEHSWQSSLCFCCYAWSAQVRILK